MRAVELYQKACERDFAPACYSLGVHVAADKQERAAQLYEQACTHAYPLACFNLGVAFQTGRGVPQNPARAVELFAKACDEGDARSCFSLAVAYNTGWGVTKSWPRVIELMQKICDGHVGCQYRVEGGAIDLPSCREGIPEACNKLAAEYELGVRVPKDKPRTAGERPVDRAGITLLIATR